MKISAKWYLIGAFVFAFVFGLQANVAQAATINVDTTNDELNGNGNCSLREAVRAANTNTAVDNCIAGSTGADIINIPAGTYTLSIAGAGEDAALTGDLDITDTNGSLTIQGDSALTSIIDGGDIDRIFDVFGGVTLTINDLTITNGQVADDGGGIRNSESFLTINNSIISNNETTGTLPDGGGLYNDDNNSGNPPNGFLVVNNSAIINNITGDRGGGIYGIGIASNITINNSTISGNQSFDDGAGLSVSGSSSVLVIDNSTIANNTATDIDSQGGGMDEGTGSATIKNTIIANNSAPISPDCWADDTITVNYSLFEDTTNCTISGGNNQNGVDPNLAALAANGGGTPTHALLSPSNAIDNGDTVSGGTAAGGCLDSTASLVNVDQRGAARAQGTDKGDNGCDIGAFEYNAPLTPTAVSLKTLAASEKGTSNLLLLLTVVISLTAGGIIWRRRQLI